MITSIRLDEDTMKMIDELIKMSEKHIPGIKITRTDIIKSAIRKTWYEMKKEIIESNL